MGLNIHDTSATVLVTGATGQIGSVLAEKLAAQGVTVVACSSGYGNFADEGQLAAALKGVDAAFLLVPFAEPMFEWGQRFVDLAAASELRFILKLSGLGAAVDCESAIGRLHGQIDEAVRNSGIPYCILRANAFMQNFSGLYAGMIRKHGALFLPEADAALNFIDTRDIGEAAANILLEPGPHAGRSYDLDGPEALTNAAVTDLIGAKMDRHIVYHPISAAEANANYRKLGISAWKIEILDSLTRYIRAGNASRDSEDLMELLGREPTVFAEFARDYRDCWTAQ